jgi:hypothetical protein
VGTATGPAAHPRAEWEAVVIGDPGAGWIGSATPRAFRQPMPSARARDHRSRQPGVDVCDLLMRLLSLSSS